METILIATDFSTAGRSATQYGFELARLAKAKVILLSVNEVNTATDLVNPVTPLELERLRYKKLLEEAELFDKAKTVALATDVRFGDVVASIIEAATHHNASFIVTGMKQGTFELRKLLGSTVTTLVKQSPVPVIVVPARYTFSAPKRIVLACDLTAENDFSVLDPMKTLAHTFNAEVYVVRVIKDVMDEPISNEGTIRKLINYFGDIITRFDYNRAGNIAKALTDFVDHRGINLVTVIPHEHSFFEKLFSRSVTRDLIFESHVPLLVLPVQATLVSIKDNRTLAEQESVFNIH